MLCNAISLQFALCDRMYRRIHTGTTEMRLHKASVWSYLHFNSHNTQCSNRGETGSILLSGLILPQLQLIEGAEISCAAYIVLHLCILAGSVIVPILNPAMVNSHKVVAAKLVAMVMGECYIVHLLKKGA